MHRSHLIELITAFAEEAKRSGERDAALVLFTLVLALREGTETEFACFVALFAPKRSEGFQWVSAA